MDKQNDVIVGSSSTSDENNADSSNANTQEFVPYDRFKEVIDQKNESNKKVEDLESRLGEIENKFTPAVKEESKPDVFDDPEGYENYLLSKFEAKQTEKSNASIKAKKQADEYIDNQFTQLADKGVKLDDSSKEEIAEFADKHGIRTEKGSYDLIKAHELMAQLNLKKDSTARANFAPAGYGSHTQTKNENDNISQFNSVDDINQQALK